MSGKKIAVFVTMLLCFCSAQTGAQLQVGFYQFSCPMAEFIVKQEVRNAFIRDSGVAAGLIRLHFHDCFVRGCDGSILIDSTPANKAEKDAVKNPTLRGFEVIDSAKASLEAVCKGVVSCADILAFAARDSVEITGGLRYAVPAGRRDGRASLASEPLSNMPKLSFNLDQLTTAFSNRGLTQDEMVTLSGAHTVGRSHCTSITKRLYNFDANTSQDLALDPDYASQLKQQCPQEGSPNLVVPMDPSSPDIADVGYYRSVLVNRGLFATDQVLLASLQTRLQVFENAQNPFLWASKFAAAMVKMGNIGVLTESEGEIRANCRVINN